MLIDVKSTQKHDAEQGGGKRYEFSTAERLSRLPAIFAMVVVGIAVYLRSMTATAARQSEEPEERSTKDQPAAAPRDERVAELDDLAVAGVDQGETGSIAEDDPPQNTIGRGNPWPAAFQPPDFPQFHFVAPTFLAPSVPVLRPAAVFHPPVNDNVFGLPYVPAFPLVQEPPRLDSSDHSEDDKDDNDDDDTVNPSNRAPVAMGPVRLNDVFAGQMVLIGLVHLLRGASDPDGDELAVYNIRVSGADLVNTQNGWALQTEHGMMGPVRIAYRITDGRAWIDQTAELDIVRMQHLGTSGDDLMVGSPYDDDIDARDGNDIVDAMDGNDHVEGGAGDDHINGGAGDDVLVGGEGDDIIFAGAGNDVVFGGNGHDRLFGEAGNDTLFGDAGDDYINGGIGDDHLHGGHGHDTLIGDLGDDRLFGGAGADHLDGGLGDDLLDGGEGADTLIGGSGNDVLIDGDGDDTVSGGDGDDTLIASTGDDVLDGGQGHDIFDASATSDDIVVDLVGGTVYGASIGTDTISGIEEFKGGSGDDLFVVGGRASVLSGGRGRDTFVFEVTDHDPTLSEDVVHKILDFVVGDRVRVREYDLGRDNKRAEKDLFEAIYGDDDDDWLNSDIPLQVRHERIDDMDWTVILADIDGDHSADIAINIQGVLLTAPEHLA